MREWEASGKKKMDGDPFIADVRVNGTDFVPSLVDYGCLCYGAISKRTFHSLQLPHIRVQPRILENAAGDGKQVRIDKITYVSIDLDGHQQYRVFMYVIDNLNWDMILGKQWMEDQDVHIHAKEGYLEIGSSGVQIRDQRRYRPPQLDASNVMAATFLAEARRDKRECGVGVFAVTMADIDKALRPKVKIDPMEKLPPQYHKWSQAFSQQLADLLPPHRPGVDLQIEILRDEHGREKPLPWGPLYSMSREELLVLRKTLTELLDKGFIRVSSSPAAAPVLMVKKPGGGIRFCVDYRGLNKITKRDRYPLPLLSETLRTIAKARWFTKVDVIAAFHKIRVAPGDEEKTAFRTRYGSFEWLVVPFGLTGAPAAFQRYINSVLQDYLDDFVSAYIDDVLIFSSGTLQDHREKVGKVLQRLMDAGLQLDISKSEFEVKTVKYLGFIIEAENGIRVDPEKVRAVKEWSTPKNVKSVRSFIGFANFYRIFLPEFSDIAEPLTRLTKKDVPFYWDDTCEEAFDKIKDLLITAPILSHFHPERETTVETDSSGFAVGGVLSQRDDRDGLMRPVAYFSKKHSPAEANYAIHDKELLAIVRCLEQWEPELRAVERFKVLTDHKNLRYFYSERRLTERQVRWSEFLSRFQFTLEWRPGRKGGLPDALSRRDQDMPTDYSDERLKGRIMRVFQNDHLRRVPISTLSTNPEGSRELNFEREIRLFEDKDLQQLWHTARQEDRPYQELTKLIANGEKTLPTNLQKEKAVSISECSLDNRGLLCFRERVWIPDSEPLRTKIIQETHDSHITGHPGRDLTYSVLSRRFFWPGAASAVRRFVRNCEVCGRNTIWRDTKKGLLKPLPIPQRIWSEVTIDFITDLPPSGRDAATNCMVVTDRLTKGVELEGLDDISSEAVAKRLFERHYPVHGIPTAITSDRGPQFVSDMWKHFCRLLRIEQRLSTAYHPQTDGATERMNQEVEKILRIWTNYLQENWLDLLPIAMATINGREATSTGLSPFFFMHGYHNEPIQLFEDRRAENPKEGEAMAEEFIQRLQDANEFAQAAIAMAQEIQQAQANKHRTAAPRYKPGDCVYLNLKNVKTSRPCKKLDWLHAKYQVLEEVNTHAYKLDVPGRIHPVFHVDLLRPAPDDPLPSQQTDHELAQPVLVDGQEMYLVESILDEKKEGTHKKALVKWVDYSKPTWESLSTIRHTDAWKQWKRKGRKRTSSANSS